MKRLLNICLALAFSLICFSSCETFKPQGLSVVATNFPAYDFAKNIIGDNGTVTLLLPPGGESHTYEPTAKDIMKISECALFIYNGGESDTWVEGVLSSLDKKPASVKMMDFVDLCKEEHEHGEHDHEVDEHIWTSPKNAMKIINGISKEICRLDNENSDYYKINSEKYISEIEKLDRDFEELFASSKRKTIVVADRFPFTYFTNEYGLKYYAAYHSCSEDAEPTPTVIAELIDAVKRENIPIVFYIEFSNKTVATAVSKDTGAAMAELNSCHSVTKKQLESGVTYVDIMRENYDVLKKAVNL